jgi:hypothetical protein
MVYDVVGWIAVMAFSMTLSLACLLLRNPIKAPRIAYLPARPVGPLTPARAWPAKRLGGDEGQQRTNVILADQVVERRGDGVRANVERLRVGAP